MNHSGRIYPVRVIHLFWVLKLPLFESCNYMKVFILIQRLASALKWTKEMVSRVRWHKYGRRNEWEPFIYQSKLINFLDVWLTLLNLSISLNFPMKIACRGERWLNFRKGQDRIFNKLIDIIDFISIIHIVILPLLIFPKKLWDVAYFYV